MFFWVSFSWLFSGCFWFQSFGALGGRHSSPRGFVLEVPSLVSVGLIVLPFVGCLALSSPLFNASWSASPSLSGSATLGSPRMSGCAPLVIPVPQVVGFGLPWWLGELQTSLLYLSFSVALWTESAFTFCSFLFVGIVGQVL